jgi:hypothetical protein
MSNSLALGFHPALKVVDFGDRELHAHLLQTRQGQARAPRLCDTAIAPQQEVFAPLPVGQVGNRSMGQYALPDAAGFGLSARTAVNLNLVRMGSTAPEHIGLKGIAFGIRHDHAPTAMGQCLIYSRLQQAYRRTRRDHLRNILSPSHRSEIQGSCGDIPRPSDRATGARDRHSVSGRHRSSMNTSSWACSFRPAGLQEQDQFPPSITPSPTITDERYRRPSSLSHLYGQNIQG